MVYLPPAFTETREEVLFAHIERHDFGLLVTHGAAGLIASQIPFLAERRDGGGALAVFCGPHAYISPGWYEARPAVPTWNYASVHAYGAPRRIDDPAWLRDLVRRLSERHQARAPAPRGRT